MLTCIFRAHILKSHSFYLQICLLSTTTSSFRREQQRHSATIRAGRRHLVTVLSNLSSLPWAVIINHPRLVAFSCSWSITNHLLTGFMSLIDKHLGLAIIEITQPSIMIDTPPVYWRSMSICQLTGLSASHQPADSGGWKKVMNDEIETEL